MSKAASVFYTVYTDVIYLYFFEVGPHAGQAGFKCIINCHLMQKYCTASVSDTVLGT